MAYLETDISFFAYLNTTRNNVTGNGTTYDIVYDAESYDTMSSFDTGTGIFTAPFSGKYLLTVGMQVNELSDSTTDFFSLIETSNRNYQIFRGNAGVIRLGGSFFGFSSSIIADMEASDTAFVSITATQSGGLVADLPSGETINFFSGKLLR